MFYDNWKTISNNPSFHTESENPILKKDEHRAEIIDITDGLVVEDMMFNYEYELLDNYEPLTDNSIWNAFSNSKEDNNSNLNKKHI